MEKLCTYLLVLLCILGHGEQPRRVRAERVCVHRAARVPAAAAAYQRRPTQPDSRPTSR